MSLLESVASLVPLRTALLAAAIVAIVSPASAQPAGGHLDQPSRAAEKGCKWERFADPHLALDLWVQRCDYGSRKIDFVVVKNSLAQRYSDSSGSPDPVVDVFELKAGESPERGIRRLFDASTSRKLAAQCLLVPYRADGNEPGGKTPTGVKRYTFVPDAALAKAIKAKADPNDVPEPPCGDWGDAPDGVQYWEAQPASGAAKVMFVRVGQEEPLFDEATMRLR